VSVRPHPNDPNLERSSDDELVRMFADYREAESSSERQLAVRAWHVLLARSHERIRGYVATFQFPDNPDVRVARDDWDDAVQQAHERCLEKLSRNFRGTTGAEFHAAVKTCVQYTCMDHCREVMRREKRLAGSIDDPLPGADPDEEARRFDRALGRIAARLEDGRFGAALDLEAVGHALERVPNEDMRTVIRRTMEGYSSREIAAELGTSVANVDQLRSRGIRKVRDLLGDDD
jgi:RNA polymerase sigma factor (sigma-70 family)